MTKTQFGVHFLNERGVDNMKDTLKSKIGYRVLDFKDEDGKVHLIAYECNKPVVKARSSSYEQYMIGRTNKTFLVVDVFTTKAGNRYVHWAVGRNNRVDFMTCIKRGIDI